MTALLIHAANDSTHHARTHCDVYPEFDSVGEIVSPLTTIAYLVVPILILSVCNAIILHHIRKLKRRFAKKIGESAMDLAGVRLFIRILITRMNKDSMKIWRKEHVSG